MKLELQISTDIPEGLEGHLFEKLFSYWVDYCEPKFDGMILLQFVSQPAMEELVRVHQQKDGATDVLSFTYDPPLFDAAGVHVPGEIVICTDVARENAKGLGASMEIECATLFVHGLLHLTGFDHASVEDRQKFEAKTRGIMEIGGLTPVSLWLD